MTIIADAPRPEPAFAASGPSPAGSPWAWPLAGLDDDMAPVISGLVATGTPFALATLSAIDGGPRPVGAQMVVSRDGAWGFVSGGCVEADVALHARAALDDRQPRRLTYGRGSPFLDIRLPCGGRIDLLVEPVQPQDPAIMALLDAVRVRRAARYLSNGRLRRCVRPDEAADAAPGNPWVVDRLQLPSQRLVVVGSDPYALAIAAAGRHQGWEVTLVRPGGPSVPPPLDVLYRTGTPDAALAALVPDPWTAIAIATHDADLDHAGLSAALRSRAGYVGVLGSRRRLGERRARLAASGLADGDLARLRAPIGLPIAARAPRDIAVAVVAEIIDQRARALP